MQTEKGKFNHAHDKVEPKHTHTVFYYTREDREIQMDSTRERERERERRFSKN